MSFRPWRSSAAITASVFLLGVCFATAGALWLRHDIDAQAQAAFERRVARVGDEVAQRFRTPAEALVGLRGLYAAHQRVSRAEFRAYVAALDLTRSFPGVRGLGFVQRVMREDLDRFVASERADGAPQFTIRQLVDKGLDDLYVVKFSEPAAANSGAPGLDLGSEARRRATVQRTIDTGEPTLTAAITLVQDQRRSPGVVLYVPAYAQGAPVSTVEERRAALLGLLSAPIVIAELLDGVHSAADDQVDFDLFDAASGAAATGNTLLYQAGERLSDAAFGSDPARVRRFHATRTLSLPGRDYVLRVAGTPQFEAAYASPTPWLAFGCGVAISAMLALLLWQQASRRRRAESMARRMTAELERLAQVVKHTSNAVTITDRELRITWVNEGFTRISGYTLAEALGKTPGELLGSGKAEPAVLQTLAESAAAGTACRVEVLNRAKDGREYWVDTEIQPLHDAKCGLTGFMEIGSDVTATKNTERALARERASLANIIEGTNVGTWEWNVETGETRFNERWAQMIGYTLEDLSPCTISIWLRLLHPDEHARSAAQRDRHFSGELPVYECEFRLRHKDGHWVWVHSRGKLFSRNAAGAPRWMAGTHQDISQRKQAEAALRASQAFLDKTGRIAGVGGWAYDLATRGIEWTEQTCRIHDCEPGHRPTFDEHRAYYAPEALPVVDQAFRHSMATGQGFDLELPLITAQGRAIWVRAVGELEFVNATPVRIVGALQDITAWRELEAERRRNNEVLRSVLENLPCGVSVFDAELHLVAANREFRRLLDLPESLFEAPPVRFEDILRFNAARGDYGTGDIDAKVRDIIARASHPAQRHQFERVRADGLPLEIRGAPMPGGGFVTTYTDVTERKRAEAERQRASDLLRDSIDALDDAFSLFDPQDRLVLCNQRTLDLYPLSADAMLPGTPFEKILRVGAERGQYQAAAGRVDAWVAERMAEHRQPPAELMQRQTDGRVVRIVERRTQDGHTIVFRIDVTELVRATEAAQEASRAKTQFMANMSHEIRTPMSAILGMLALLCTTALAPVQTSYADKAESAARSLLRLLNEILEFSKVEEGKTILDAQPFSVETLLRELEAIFSGLVGTRSLKISMDIDPALPHGLVGDAVRLQQVLVNLVGNAVKFTEHGEVGVALKVCARDAASVTLEFMVRDTGIGIAAQDLEHIFSAFTQAEASITRRFGGTGLGLAISQRLVRLMGGEIGVESTLGQGSRFRFRVTLPVSERQAVGGLSGNKNQAVDTAATALRTLVTRPERLAGMRVLVVEDNADNRQIVRELLTLEGAAVQIASHGEEAVEKVRTAKPPFDVVLMDLQMPVMDGFTATQHIRHQLGMATLPIVAISANATTSDREACLATGMNDHVGKPFDLNDLVRVLHRHTRWPEAGASGTAETAAVGVALRQAAADAGVDIGAALIRLGGNRQVYERLLRSFSSDLRTLPERLNGLLAHRDKGEAARALHSLKGVAATLGALRLAAAAADSEKQLAPNSPIDTAQQAVARACAAIVAARPGFAALLQTLRAENDAGEGGRPGDAADIGRRANAAPGTYRGPALRQALHTLAELLHNSDMGALRAMDAMRREFGAAWGAPLLALDEATAALDFGRAQRLCRELADAILEGQPE